MSITILPEENPLNMKEGNPWFVWYNLGNWKELVIRWIGSCCSYSFNIVLPGWGFMPNPLFLSCVSFLVSVLEIWELNWKFWWCSSSMGGFFRKLLMSFCASFIFFWGWGFQGLFSFLIFTSARCHFLSLVSQLMHVLVNVSSPAFFLLGAGIACCVLDSLLACCVLVSLLSHLSNYFLQSFLFFLIFFYLIIILFVLLVS